MILFHIKIGEFKDLHILIDFGLGGADPDKAKSIASYILSSFKLLNLEELKKLTRFLLAMKTFNTSTN